MLFNSYEFIFIFLPIVFFGYFYLLHKRLVVGSKLWLALASLAFYGYWNLSYVPLILGSIFVNYLIGMGLAHKILASQPASQPAYTAFN